MIGFKVFQAGVLAVLIGQPIFQPNPVASQDFNDVEIQSTRVKDSIHLMKGAGGNIGVLGGRDGALIVDDQYAPLTEKIKTAIADITGDSVTFVVNTHWHYDHTGGNENLGRAGALIISQENSRSRMQVEQYVTDGDWDQQPYDEVGLPKVTFENSMTLHVNDETVDIFHVSHAHTDGDAIVYFRDSDVLHAGDVFVTYGIPFIDYPNGGTIDGTISAVYRIAGLITDDTIIIPGHGDLSTKEDLLRFGEMLSTIRDRILDGIRSGHSLDEVIESQPLRGFGEPSVGTSTFISWIYESLRPRR